MSFLSSTPQSNREILFRSKFSILLCLSYENCNRPRRNHTSKRENCFAIFILVCNFHIGLQFSRFSVFPTWTFAIFVSVCNSHVATLALTIVASHGSSVTMIMNSLTPCQSQFSVEEKNELELS